MFQGVFICRINSETLPVLIDAENISHNFLEDISENVALYGIVSVRRIYGDWTSEKMKGWKALPS